MNNKNSASRLLRRPRIMSQISQRFAREIERVILRQRPTSPSRSIPGSQRNVAPTARPRVASRGSVRRNYRTCRIRRLRCAIMLHRSNLTTADHSSTSTSTILWYRHSPPCQPGPAWLRRRARGCKLPPPAPGPPGLRAAPSICLDTILFFSYPLLRTSPPHLCLLLLIRHSTIDRVSAINLLDGDDARHFMRKRQSR